MYLCAWTSKVFWCLGKAIAPPIVAPGSSQAKFTNVVSMCASAAGREGGRHEKKRKGKEKRKEGKEGKEGKGGKGGRERKGRGEIGGV